MMNGNNSVPFNGTAMKKVFRLLFCLTLITGGWLKAQTNGYVFGIDNASSGVFWFSKLEVATGQLTHIAQMPWNSYSATISTCVDPDMQLYYYCNGFTMYQIDPLTGIILSTTPIGIAPTADLYHVQYNPCDSMIYGIVNDAPNNCYFARYNASNGVTTNLGNLSANMSFCGGCMCFIDPVNQLYVVHAPGALMAISLSTGLVVYNTPIVNLPNESFGHIAYDCKEGRIIGTTASSSTNLKYLATVDPVTGIVTHITQNGWTDGFWKPLNGGNSIDNYLSVYYYSGAPDLIVAVDIISGDTISVTHTGGGSFLGLQYFSQCSCDANSVATNEVNAFHVYPNPVSEQLTIETGGATTTGSLELHIHNLLGEEVLIATLIQPSSVIDLSGLANGAYTYAIMEDHSIVCRGKLIRQ